MSATVHVKGISSQTTEQEVHDFFSFCGKIQSLALTPQDSASPETRTASVTFEKETAAKTALLLDNTQLGPSQVQVTSAAVPDQPSDFKTASVTGSQPTTGEADEIAQEDKPRSRIVAEYLAHGYVVSDKAIESALALDQQHGVSARFLTALSSFDEKYKVSERAAQADEKYGVSSRAQQGWLGLSSYFEQAVSTPTGQKLRAFYEQGQKQVLDVHNEARHLASLKTGKSEEKVANPAAAAEKSSAATDEKPATS